MARIEGVDWCLVIGEVQAVMAAIASLPAFRPAPFTTYGSPVIDHKSLVKSNSAMNDNVQPEILDLARHIACEHALDPALVCAVIEQESAWNPWAVRYEPGFLSRYVAPLYTTGKLGATEAYTRAMSWGLMQVMGQVAREFVFTSDSLPQLSDPATGVELGCRILAKRMARARGDIPAALL